MNFEEMTDDIISFFDSEMWYNFKQIIPETGKSIKSNLIKNLYRQIMSGEMTIDNVFQEYNYVELEDSFLSSPNVDFLYLCLKFYPQNPFIRPFLEYIFLKAPNFITNCLECEPSFTDSYEIMTSIASVSVFLMNYNFSKSAKIQEILNRIPIEIAIREIFTFLDSFEESKKEILDGIRLNKSEFIKLIRFFCAQNELSFWNSIKIAVKKENSLSFEILKQSVGEKYQFQIIFDSLKNESNEINGQETTNITSSIPELISFFEKTNKIHQNLIDLYNSEDKSTYDYLINSIKQSIEIPESTKNDFIQKLCSLKMTTASVDIEKMNLNLNLNDHIVTIEQVVEYIERSTVGCEQFASKLFQLFHLSFMKQTEQTVKSFCDQFYLKYLKKLQFQTLNKLAEVAIQFLKSDLIQQHRQSLSALAIRLPISKYVHLLFFNEYELKSRNVSEHTKLVQKNVMKEISIIENLHVAAIQTCTFLKLNAQGYPSTMQKNKNKNKNNSNNCSLNIISNESQFPNSLSRSISGENSYRDGLRLSLTNECLTKVAVGIDRKLVLRLRWRTLRDDTSSICSYLPEFIQLCESDEKLFLKWESSCSYPIGMKRNQILMKLGILNNSEIISPLIFELLKIEWNVDDNFIEILNQFFSNNVNLKKLKIPENPNLSILFRFNFLWCTAVMYHPKICEVLRNPSKEISLSLFRSLLSSPLIRDYHNNNEMRISDFTVNDDRNTKYFDQIFTTFPLGFSATISHSANYNSLKGSSKSKGFIQDLEFVNKLKKPPQVFLAEQILNGVKKPLKNMPRYLIVSVAFEFAKRKELLRLADLANGDQIWVFFCFFYSITFHTFDISVSLLKKFDFLFSYLHKGVSEENLFAGPRKWTNGLLQFASYCSSNKIEFNEHKEWILLNDISQNAFNTPDTDSISRAGEIKSDDVDWISKDPLNESNSSSPLSSQNSFHEHSYNNPH